MNRIKPALSPLTSPTSQLVSYRSPDGLILSTGNLYFTYHDAATASVWRASQDAVPGQEILLYSEPGPQFGDIVFAEVGGGFFGYFFAQQEDGIAIKQVPLTGGAATVLAAVGDNIDIVNSHRNLVTDGANLYWQDVQSVRKMPIGGGDITVLDEASPNTPTAGLALQNGNLIYVSGLADIRYVPVGGATTPPSTRTIITGAERVTALHAVLEFIYWGEESDAIRVVLANGSSAETISTIAGFFPTSISTSTRGGGVYAQAWTQCGAPCRLHFDVPLGEDSLYTIGANALGVAVAESGNVFWGDSAGIHRHIPQ